MLVVDDIGFKMKKVPGDPKFIEEPCEIKIPLLLKVLVLVSLITTLFVGFLWKVGYFI